MSGRWSFSGKAAGAAALVILSDQLFWAHDKGWTVGLFILALAAALLLSSPAARRSRIAVVAACVAVILAGFQMERTTALGWMLSWMALGVAARAPRLGGFDDVWRWTQRLAHGWLVGMITPVLDLQALNWVASRRKAPRDRRWMLSLILPATGGFIFLVLFASANPLIAEALVRIEAPSVDGSAFVRLGMAIVALLTAWGVLRPRLLKTSRLLPIPSGGGADKPLPGVTVASVTLSLIVFNPLFALENGLDIAFLWSGARLPDAFTLAEYAHRGAYTLTAAALLSGLFVLVALRPGSESARRPLVRWLVIFWIAQTVFLVASSLHRVQIYVESYALTRVRIAAAAGMALTALGLLLILWRMLRGRSAAWLLNANAAALGVTLMVACIADPGEAAARWNLAHARQLGGKAVELDLCYLHSLGASALIPLSEAEDGARGPRELLEQIDFIRLQALGDLEQRQADWRGWTYSGARRLEKATWYQTDPGFGSPEGQARVQPVMPACERD